MDDHCYHEFPICKADSFIAIWEMTITQHVITHSNGFQRSNTLANLNCALTGSLVKVESEHLCIMVWLDHCKPSYVSWYGLTIVNQAIYHGLA